MNKISLYFWLVVFPVANSFLRPSLAQLPALRPPKVLLDANQSVATRPQATSDQVSISRNEDVVPHLLSVSIRPGEENYPGIHIQAPGAAWNLSGYGHVTAQVTNTGSTAIPLSLRVDNAGDWRDNPWNTESLALKAGESGTITTIFGYSYGYKAGYALHPDAIVNIGLFAGKSEALQSFRLDSLVADGPAGEKPPVDAEALRVEPINGVLLGSNIAGNGASQIAVQGGARASYSPGKLRIEFSPTHEEQSVAWKPVAGKWNLRDFSEVRVQLRNEGQTALTPRIRLETSGGPSPWIESAAPLTPGSKKELIIRFAGKGPVNLSDKASENHLVSNAVSALTLGATDAAAGGTIIVESISAKMPAASIPLWLGRRPPVAGDWIKTLDDEFSGQAINASVWNVTGSNYYDKRSHWSKNNVVLGNGQARLRYEKKRGHQNDDPKEVETEYAVGYLDSYNKWTQRYGYFEARLKLPQAPGLWPAFWTIPDRGPRVEAKWQRNSTADGGMEFDIMENLTGWGSNRYNIAHHWDGYEKDHKSNGSDKIYVQPDKAGFLTVGLLWTPGSAIYYCNGREVLRWENERVASVPAMLMFTLPSGGWDNTTLDDAQLPADLIIDYVRVWQRKDLISAAASNPQ